MTVIKSGSVSIASGSADVVGSGTTWASGPKPARPGDTFMVPSSGFVSTIAAVSSDTAITLESVRSGGAIAGAGFEIRLDAPSRLSGVSAVAALGAMAERYQLLASNIRLPLVVSVGANAPPGSPTLDDRYVVGTAPTGAWAGYANQIAVAATTGWRFEAPVRGDGVADDNTSDWFFWSGTAWIQRGLGVGAVRFDAAQTLTGGERAQAQTNLGFPALAANQVIQSIGGALTAQTVAAMLNNGVGYQAGTFTPILSTTGVDPTVSYTAQIGRYWRLGALVQIYARVAGTRSGGTGIARVGALPFVAHAYTPVHCRMTGVSVPGAPFAIVGTNGTAEINYANSAGVAQDLIVTSIESSFGITLAGSYLI